MNTKSLRLFGNYVGFIVPQEVTPHLYSWEISLSLFLRSLFIIMTLIFSFSSSRKTQVYAFMYSLYAFRSCDIAINVQCIPGAKHLFYLNINQMFIYKHVLQFYKHTWYFKFLRFNILHLNMFCYQQIMIIYRQTTKQILIDEKKKLRREGPAGTLILNCTPWTKRQ